MRKTISIVAGLLSLLLWRLYPIHASGNAGNIIVLHAGHVFDSENGKMLSTRDIVVRDGTIISVEDKAEIPDGADVYDLSNYTVLPGLIDSHTHLLLSDKSDGKDAGGEILRNIKLGTTLRALEAVPRAADFLMNGITTVRDLGNSGLFGDLALQAAINNGSIIGPRIIAAGMGLSPMNGQLPVGTSPEIVNQEYRVVLGAADARMAVQENVKRGVNLIKVYADNAPNHQTMTLEEIRAIVAEARTHGLRVTAHAVNDESVKNAAMAGVDSIEHAYNVSDDTLKLMAQKKIVLVPTDPDRETLRLLIEKAHPGSPDNAQKIDEYMQPLANRLLRAQKFGVRIASGSDMYLDLSSIGFSAGVAARNVIYSYVDNGLSNTSALQAATVNGAALMGFEGKLGVLKQGAYADIIAVAGDPTAQIRSLNKVVFVMKNGRVYLKPQ